MIAIKLREFEMPKAKRGVPGNSMEEQRLFQEELVREGASVRLITNVIRNSAGRGLYILALRFVIKNDEGTDVLLVVQAQGDNGYVVAFLGGTSVLECCRTLVSQSEAGTLRWKADEYRNK